MWVQEASAGVNKRKMGLPRYRRYMIARVFKCWHLMMSVEIIEWVRLSLIDMAQVKWVFSSLLVGSILMTNRWKAPVARGVLWLKGLILIRWSTRTRRSRWWSWIKRLGRRRGTPIILIRMPPRRMKIKSWRPWGKSRLKMKRSLSKFRNNPRRNMDLLRTNSIDWSTRWITRKLKHFKSRDKGIWKSLCSLRGRICRPLPVR